MFKYLGRLHSIGWTQTQPQLALFRLSQFGIASESKVIHDPNKNKYQENKMLFFSDPKPDKKKLAIKPRTISDIKKLQTFVQQYKSEPGKSLNESIKSMAKRDESFNEFLKNFKAKNEQNWSSIIDLTQAEQEEKLLEKTPDYRKNEMIMMEEFRRRKNLKSYYEQMKTLRTEQSIGKGKAKMIDLSDEAITRESTYISSGPERFFTPDKDEIFNPSDFTLIFLDSDSVTNVTALNRINHRRVLLFIGNGQGIISYAMGKADDYEAAFEEAFKKLRQNLICINLDQAMTVPQVLKSRHNDFRLTIFPQMQPNYWGHPVIWKMLIHTGFFHCRFVVKSRKKDPYSMVYAFFQAVTQNKTLDQISQISGRKIHQISFGNATTQRRNLYATTLL